VRVFRPPDSNRCAADLLRQVAGNSITIGIRVTHVFDVDSDVIPAKSSNVFEPLMGDAGCVFDQDVQVLSWVLRPLQDGNRLCLWPRLA
jgi:hypothetical protein